MFDIGWSEMLVVGVVLVVVVGPKDLPGMLRTFGKTTKQLRSMAGDFRKQFDEALREAELDDVKSTVDDMRKLDPTKDIRKAMNPMKAIGEEIRSSLKTGSESPDPTVAKTGNDAVPDREPLKKSGEAAMTGAKSEEPPDDVDEWESFSKPGPRPKNDSDRGSEAADKSSNETADATRKSEDAA